ncbi:xanthine dehydrogenase family protein molybdopterin-binding subunit [Thioclava electrotropha]|uniref:Xanthine dehydrogenase family protein molybdopterin-binding subunit n=1 Tax=Thioclava electrotropha TaxID=1549850 RepID=A0ABX6YR67_9RHOB|nr:xanthine dehydrogenase family protein molybdopterin-binding subunit [Thioclava electrotropha]QPZ90304.1 xanthine dehydrogenase family protein molybdopterin-binding subunit [Thioclava electrotropha]
MSDTFTMDEAQPRLLDETKQGLVGAPLDRPEGKLKVTGTATYAAEFKPDGMVHGVMLRATITRGKVTGFDETEAKKLPGYLGLFHGPEFVRNPAQGMAGAAPVQPGDRVDYHGQPIGLVVAESFETARDAAARIKINYEQNPGAPVDPAGVELELNEKRESIQGDLDAAMEKAAQSVDLEYTTAGHVAAAMEPHAGIAEWKDGRLVLHGSLQMVRFNKEELAGAVGIESDKVHILAPYVGGGFGSKLGISSEHVAAALAARELDRPVRIVLSRQTVFDAVLRRTETWQRLRLSADASGKLTGIGHEDRVSNLEEEAFSEPVNAASRFMYGAPNRVMRQHISRNHRTPTGSVRAPGEAVGTFALETAMDELAEKLGLCPVELRLRNIPEKHPDTGQAYSARALEDSLREGAKRFGWDQRPETGTRREGEWLIGMGVAAAGRANFLVPSAARVTLSADGALVETDMTDIGTGSYAILGQIAGEMLGLPIDKVSVHLADSDLPGASGSGGSFGASSSGSSVFLAARKIREQLADKLGCKFEELSLGNGEVSGGGKTAKLVDLLSDPISAEGKIEGGKTAKSHFSAGFGAHFAEVAVNEVSGEVRVRRMLGVLGIGRVLNEKTARSQAVGGMVWGVGSALHEELGHDPRTGHIVTRDLANYHVPSHADIPRQMEVVFLPERDDEANPIQSKGVGELGISGAGAAVINAIHNATGVRLRHYPATPDKVLEGFANGR